MKGTPVQTVIAPNSTVLPPDVVALAARRSGMIGNPLSIESVQGVARDLKQWYTRKGYVLSSVMGATLKADSATAELEVQEPKISKMPVGITFCKEMVIEDDDSLVTYRKYKEKHALRKTFGYEKIDKANLNMTFVETSGRTNPTEDCPGTQVEARSALSMGRESVGRCCRQWHLFSCPQGQS